MKLRIVQALWLACALVLWRVVVVASRVGYEWQEAVWVLVLLVLVAVASFHAGERRPLDGRYRNNTLKIGVERPKRFELSPLPLIKRCQKLEVEVAWGANPDGWDSICVDGFRDLAGRPVETTPAELVVERGVPGGSIEIAKRERHWRRYLKFDVSYRRTVDGVSETWTLDPPGETICDWP